MYKLLLKCLFTFAVTAYTEIGNVKGAGINEMTAINGDIVLDQGATMELSANKTGYLASGEISITGGESDKTTLIAKSPVVLKVDIDQLIQQSLEDQKCSSQDVLR